MDAFITPQNLTIAGLAVLLLVALVARFFASDKQTQGSHNRFGVDHSQDIFEMSQRTQAENQRLAHEPAATTLGR